MNYIFQFVKKALREHQVRLCAPVYIWTCIGDQDVCLNFMKFRIDNLYKKLSSKLEFRKNRVRDNHTLLKGVYKFLFLDITYSMVQSPSWEANWFAASQEIPSISRNPKVHYRTHKRPPPVPILGQPNPVHIPTSCHIWTKCDVQSLYFVPPKTVNATKNRCTKSHASLGMQIKKKLHLLYFPSNLYRFRCRCPQKFIE